MDSLSQIQLHKQTGKNKIEKARTFKNPDEAEPFYFNALQWLLDVNGWTALTGAVGGKYNLFTPQAVPKTDSAEECDFIRFTRFNSLSKTGGEEQWYRIERIVTKLHGNDRSAALVIRPTTLTIGANNVTYSFNTEEHHTLLIQLNRHIVTAGVYTKNGETARRPEATSVYHKIRHALRDVFAWADTQKNHWEILVESLIK